MPITPVQAVGTLVPSMASVAMVGMGVPKFAMGFGIGLSTWTPTIQIQTVDTGILGVGKGVPVPILLISSVLQTNLHLGLISQGLLGVLEPAFVQGLTQGLVQLYAQALTNTVHAGVSIGAGVAIFIPPPAIGHFLAGFSAMGMSGEAPTKIATALAMAMENTFRMLVLPQPIIGPPNIVPGAGSGFGTII